MKPTAPLLPETAFQPLSAARLEAMISHALGHSQLPAQAQVITLRRAWPHNLVFGTGMAAMAASILLLFLATPQISLLSPLTATDYSASADLSDLLLLESFGA